MKRISLYLLLFAFVSGCGGDGQPLSSLPHALLRKAQLLWLQVKHQLAQRSAAWVLLGPIICILKSLPQIIHLGVWGLCNILFKRR